MVTTDDPKEDPAPVGRQSPRTVCAGVIGNVLEWYDFGLFGFFAPIISQQFFPAENRVASLLQTFGIFALGYLMRPIGGVLFGHIGDRIGRKRALELSVLLMAVPTTCIGLLPTYAEIGLIAPLLLTAIRVLQGLSVGGEFIGSIAFLGEHASSQRRGLMGSFATTSAGLGILAGSGVAALVTSTFDAPALQSWGWRVPFLFGFLVGGVGLWLRFGLPESPRFAQAVQQGEVTRLPIKEALQHNRRAVLLTLAMTLMLSVGFYIPFVWVAAWLATINHPPLAQHDALTANTLALATSQLLIPLSGFLSDRLRRKPILIVGAASYALFSIPIFMLLREGTFAAAVGGLIAFAACNALCGGALPATLVELFPTRTRYSGIALGYNTAQALFGGSAPMVATWLIQTTGSSLAPAVYLTGMSIISLGAAFLIPDRTRQPLL